MFWTRYDLEHMLAEFVTGQSLHARRVRIAFAAVRRADALPIVFCALKGHDESRLCSGGDDVG
jgi:acetyl/propionyl-CoA carboxylase alpha subunit